MADRVTAKRVDAVLASYVETLQAHGYFTPKDGYRVAWGQPYGNVYRVFTTNAGRDNRHDVPGFTGDSPFVSLRELYDAIYQARRVVGDIAYPVTD